MKWQYSFDQSTHKEQANDLGFTQLGAALKMLGFALNDAEVELLKNRYQDRNGVLRLDDYLKICARCYHAKCVFKRSVGVKGKESLETFTLKMLYI
jgi:hypothetical protein